jgi:hypothetical protein
MDEVGTRKRKREQLFFEREGQDAWGPSTTFSTHVD